MSVGVITVVERVGHEPADGPSEDVASQVGRVVRAGSVSEAVHGVLEELEAGEELRRLDLVGHGTPGLLSLGAGALGVAMSGHYLSADVRTFEPLRDLVPRFAEGASLRLLGCYLAQGLAGRVMLGTMASLLGVTVHACRAPVLVREFDDSGFAAHHRLEPFAPGGCVCASWGAWDESADFVDLPPLDDPPADDPLADVASVGVWALARYHGARASCRAGVHPGAAFVDLFDRDPFDGVGRLRADAVVRVERTDGTLATWQLVLGHRALLVPGPGAPLLYRVAPGRRAVLMRDYGPR